MVKPYFDEHNFNLNHAELELQSFDNLLKTNTDLAERAQVLSSIKQWPNLCALMGQYNARVGIADLIRREFRIPPHFRTDLTVRRAGTNNICLIEFEGASNRSMFEESDRGVDTWARSLEKGFSQVVDWTWAMNEYRQISDYVDAFGSNRPNLVGVLVIGRSTDLNSSSRKDRWLWRKSKVLVDSFPLTIVTFDELYADLADWIEVRKSNRGV